MPQINWKHAAMLAAVAIVAVIVWRRYGAKAVEAVTGA